MLQFFASRQELSFMAFNTWTVLLLSIIILYNYIFPDPGTVLERLKMQKVEDDKIGELEMVENAEERRTASECQDGIRENR